MMCFLDTSAVQEHSFYSSVARPRQGEDSGPKGTLLASR